jgi:hypothetical protein
VLGLDEPTVVQYHAPGAACYQLRIHALEFPKFVDDAPMFAAESSDGAFSIELRQDPLVGAATQLVASVATIPGESAAERVARYVEAVTPAFEALTGRKPNGVPCPVYVTVIAESDDGAKKAGLVHSYLVEIPAATVEATIQPSGPQSLPSRNP